MADGIGATGRRGPRTGPRGVAVDPAALAEVAAALGDMPRRPDLLIEALHAVQARHGALRARHLRALAEAFGLPPVAPYEVASFYAHFEVIADDAPAPPAVTVRVCDGLPCAMAGAAALAGAVRAALPSARVVAAPCMGMCDRAPAAAVGHAPVPGATAGRVRAAAEGRMEAPRPVEAWDGAALRRAVAGALTPEGMLAALRESGLRGLGGAGFPAARKWALVAAQPGPRHLVVNADEGEPGTVKDRWCLERTPHRVLEGMLLAAACVGAETCWIYLRDEYADLLPRLRGALTDIEGAGLLRAGVEIRRGAGAYICGEETALLESLEGRRGYPRHKPPFPGVSGLFGRPTLIHNVETLWWLPEILDGGAAGYAAAGRRGRTGMRLFSVSGRVRRPGVVRAPAGVTARELVEEFCGGMAEGHRLLAYLPGGASGGILPERLADLPLDFGTLEAQGCFIGSAAVIVLSDGDDPAEAARGLLRFFRAESCGQCTPCRVGTDKAVALLAAPRWDRPLLTELAGAMADGSICGLGQAAMNPVTSLLRHMPDAVP